MKKIISFFRAAAVFFKGVWNLLTINGLTLLVFEVVYKFLGVTVCKPLLHGIARLLLRANGYAFITDANIHELVKNPLLWLFLFVVLVLISLYTLFDICCIVICYHASYRKQRLPLLGMMKRGILAAKNIIYPKNYRMMLYLLLILPMSQVVTMTGVLGGFSMPKFVMQFIEERNWLYLIFILASIYVEIVCIQWIFCFHHFTLTGDRFKRATRKSNAMVKGTKFWKNAVIILAWDVGMILAYYGILFLGGAVIALLSSASETVHFIPIVVESAVAVFLDIVAGVFYCFSIPIIFLGVSGLFYFHLERCGKQDKIPGKFNLKGSYRIEDKLWFQKLYRKKGLLVMLGLAIVLGFNIGNAYVNQTRGDDTGEVKRFLITAHRGYSAAYPENTLPAFQGAIDHQADMIEIDVHITADDKVVVIHDENLQRTTGLDREVWEMRAKDIQALDCGKWFSEEFAGTRIPGLEEVVELAKENNIMLTVELKPTVHKDGLAEAVIDILQQYGYAESCVLASLDYAELEDAKAYDESVTTAYITTVSYGDIAAMEAADGFSIEATMATAELIRVIHKRGKFVYVWTVNHESEMDKIIKLNPDGIITDEPENARRILNEIRSYSYWENYVNRLRDMM